MILEELSALRSAAAGPARWYNAINFLIIGQPIGWCFFEVLATSNETVKIYSLEFGTLGIAADE